MVMSNRVLFVSSTEPCSGRSGGGLTALGIQRCLELDADVRTVTVRAGDYLHTLDDDLIVAYHFGALEALRNSGLKAHIAFLGDPPHKPGTFRWKDTPVSLTRQYAQFTYDTWRDEYRWPRKIRALTENCSKVYAFSAGEAEYYRSIGVDCAYMRTPIPDLAKTRTRKENSGPLQILLIGHVQGTVTRSGLVWFFDHVAPYLHDAEYRIVGADNPDPLMRRLTYNEHVNWVGRVDDPSDEFNRCDIVVVPTQIQLGVRVRILDAWAHGCCVVGTHHDRFGIPEMDDGENCIVTNNSEEMIATINGLTAYREHIPFVGRSARATYERYFGVRSILQPTSKLSKLSETLESATCGRSRA